MPQAVVEQGVAPGQLGEPRRKVAPGGGAAQRIVQEDQRRSPVGLTLHGRLMGGQLMAQPAHGQRAAPEVEHLVGDVKHGGSIGHTAPNATGPARR